MSRYMLMLVLGIVAAAVSYTIFAQEEEYMEFSYGTVVKIDSSVKEIVVSEYDLENDIEGNVTYLVAPDAEFDGVSSIREIKGGDEISIDYIEDENGRKIAKRVSIYREGSISED